MIISVPTCIHELHALFGDVNRLHDLLYDAYPTMEEWLSELARVAVCELEPDDHEYLFTMTNPDVIALPMLASELKQFIDHAETKDPLSVGFLRRAFIAITGTLN